MTFEYARTLELSITDRYIEGIYIYRYKLLFLIISKTISVYDWHIWYVGTCSVISNDCNRNVKRHNINVFSSVHLKHSRQNGGFHFTVYSHHEYQVNIGYLGYVHIVHVESSARALTHIIIFMIHLKF
jgi:hypothetical protein